MSHDHFIIEQLLKTKTYKSKAQRLLDRIKAPKPAQAPEFKSHEWLEQRDGLRS